MPFLESQELSPSSAAMVAFVVLADAHLGEPEIALETEAQGITRQALVNLRNFELVGGLAVFLWNALNPGADEYRVAGSSPSGVGALSGRIQASKGDARLDLVAWEGMAGSETWAFAHFERLFESIQKDPSVRPDSLGRAWSISKAHAPGAQVLALAREGHVGVDLELLEPSPNLDAPPKGCSSVSVPGWETSPSRIAGTPC